MVNTALGHEAGDRLIIDSARRMRGALDESALLARAQSDEFLVLFGDIDDIDEAAVQRALGRGAVSVMLALLTTFAFVILLLFEAPTIRTTVLSIMSPERAARLTRVSALISRSASGYVLGNLLTSLAAGIVVYITLALLSVPFAFLFGLWVALVDFLPTIGGAIAGIPTVLFAFGHSFSAGVITAVVFVVYTQLENHVLNPMVMSRTVKVNPLTVFVAVLIGAEVGAWVGGLFGGFVGVLLAVPAAATLQVLIIETWTSTRPTPVSGQLGESG